MGLYRFSFEDTKGTYGIPYHAEEEEEEEEGGTESLVPTKQITIK